MFVIFKYWLYLCCVATEKDTNNYTTMNNLEEIYQTLSNIVNKSELLKLYPNGYISFAIKHNRGDIVTMQLINSIKK